MFLLGVLDDVFVGIVVGYVGEFVFECCCCGLVVYLFYFG